MTSLTVSIAVGVTWLDVTAGIVGVTVDGIPDKQEGDDDDGNANKDIIELVVSVPIPLPIPIPLK